MTGTHCPPCCWDLPSAACVVMFCNRGGKSWDRGLTSVGFPAKDLAGFPGAPHHILNSLDRCTCPATHIVPWSPLGAGAAAGLPTNTALSSFPRVAGRLRFSWGPGALGRAGPMESGEPAQKDSPPPRLLLPPDAKPGAPRAMWKRPWDMLSQDSSNQLP